MPRPLIQADVFIAGGGPAGLAAAIALRQAGFGVAVADCAQPPIDKACGEGIMPDGLDALHELGITIPVEIASPFRGIRFIGDRDEVAADFSHNVGLGLRRTVLHHLMVERARKLGVSLHWGARISGEKSGEVLVNGESIRYGWLICADGQNSKLRRLSGLDTSRLSSRRFGFRRHYRITPWSRHVEVHWSDCGQMYVTPVGADEVCVALITRRAQFRFDDAFPYFPKLAARLQGVTPMKDHLGALTTTRQFAAVYRRNLALIGEASGSVDAVTGEGLSMAFRQALALAEALRHGDLRRYGAAHRRIARVPRTMSALMLTMDRYPAIRRRALHALSLDPSGFGRMLAIHTGAMPLRSLGLGPSLAMGWRLLT